MSSKSFELLSIVTAPWMANQPLALGNEVEQRPLQLVGPGLAPGGIETGILRILLQHVQEQIAATALRAIVVEREHVVLGKAFGHERLDVAHNVTSNAPDFLPRNSNTLSTCGMTSW